MAVAHGHLHVGVAQVLLHSHQGYSRHHQLTREAVSQVVESNHRYTRTSGGLPERKPHQASRQEVAILLAEHQLTAKVAGVLEGAMQPIRHRDRARPPTLGCGDISSIHAAYDPQLVSLKVHVLPTQREQLTLAHPGSERGEEEGEPVRLHLAYSA